MTRKNEFLKLLNLHGTDITYKTMDQNGVYSEAQGAKAFIQPLRYKNKMYIGNSYIPIGGVDGGRYLYLGNPELRFDKATDEVIITSNNNDYYVKRAEPYVVDNEVLYIWAILGKHSIYTENDTQTQQESINGGGT